VVSRFVGHSSEGKRVWKASIREDDRLKTYLTSEQRGLNVPAQLAS
jgi:hypothetical protein